MEQHAQAEQLTKPEPQSTDLYDLLAWLHANRKQVITVLSIVAVIGCGIGLYIWYQNDKEERASGALSLIRTSSAGEEEASLAVADSYLKVADGYPGTKAAERALLIAGGIQFDAGKFDNARASFDRFMSQYSSSPFANSALLGVAASLEAMGKTSDAASRYDDLLKHHSGDATAPQVKSALARCYVAMNKPEQALSLYEELARDNANDTWSSEARIQAHELVVKFPNLAKPKVVAAPAAAAVPSVAIPAAPATNK